MKSSTLITASVLFLAIGTSAQNLPKKSDADLYWDTMPQRSFGSVLLDVGPEVFRLEDSTIVDLELHGDKHGLLAKRNESIIRKNIYIEIFNRMLRDWGIEFWRRFPDDPRRFQWLSTTSYFGPAYFTNLREGAVSECERKYVLALDTIAKNQWQRLSQAYFREVSISTQMDELFKKSLLRQQLEILPHQRWRNSEYDKFDIDRFVDNAIEFSNKYGEEEGSRIFKNVLIYKSDLGLDNADVKHYINRLKATRFKSFQREAAYLEKIVRLQEIPLTLRTKSIEGDQIDLKGLRGKLVLVDFWNVYCGECILLMPEIKAVYDRYKNKGFEVVSACLFEHEKYIKNELSKIKNLHKKIEGGWPLVLLGSFKGEEGRKIFDTYGFFGVPQLLLLDEEGKLLHYNGELRNKGGLERLVKEHLQKKEGKIQKSK